MFAKLQRKRENEKRAETLKSTPPVYVYVFFKKRESNIKTKRSTSKMVPRFRVKKLSAKHPLPVYKESQLPELADSSNIQRAVPQIETGVEKEEEEEHDLQAAISAAQAAVTTGAKVEKYIPTPDASTLIPGEEYKSLYKKHYKESSTLLRFSLTVEDSIGCPYFMDEKDEKFLQEYNHQFPGEILSEDVFEKLMWECESITNHQWPHLYLDASHIPDYKSFAEYIPGHSCLKMFPNFSHLFEHWKTRRQERGGKPIQAHLSFEEAAKNEIDPYVCFRRRETKPVRKTRRSDQQSLERLKKLRSEMEMARNLLEMVLRREKIRKESLLVEYSLFEKRREVMDYQRILGIKEDDDLLALSRKKRKSTAEGSASATIKIPLHKLRKRIDKSPAQQAIETELARKKEMDKPYVDVTEFPYQPLPLSIPDQFYQPLSDVLSTKVDEDETEPRFRKRVGRCGRIFIDRIGFTPYEVRKSQGGKTKPMQKSPAPTYDRYRFDTDCNKENDTPTHSVYEVDEMDSVYLKRRMQLLSDVELRKLVKIPSMLPFSMHTIKQARAMIFNSNVTDTNISHSRDKLTDCTSSSIPRPVATSTRHAADETSSVSPNNNALPHHSPVTSNTTASGSTGNLQLMGRTPSRSSQSHATMTMSKNDLIAANKAYAMQMAAAVARQQQQQQFNAVNNKLKHNIPPLSLQH